MGANTRMSGDGADDGLGEPEAVLEARFVGQEAVAVGVDQLDDLERLAAIPGMRGGEPLAPEVEIDGCEPAAQLVVEHADQFGIERDLRAAAPQVGDEPEQPAAATGVRPNTTTSGKSA